MDHKIIGKRNYLYEFLVILNGLVLIGIWWLILRSPREAMMAGCVSYVILAWCLRLTFQKHHIKGIQFLKAKNYADAAAAFRQSLDFFEKHPAIDRYRFITMFSSSAIPYQQMVLNNLGICYLHLGENAKALEAFQKLADLNCNYPYIAKTIEEIQEHMTEASEC